MSTERYDLVLVGSSFASMFFLSRWLQHPGHRDARVLVLEKGPRRDLDWQLAHRGRLEKDAEATFVNRTPRKPWSQVIALGGASNAWFGCAPRMLPEDFQLRSRYGVGEDWPLGYDDLEPYYCLAEEMMAVAGPSDDTPFERSRPYPQPPHSMSLPDRLLKKAYPDRFFVQPVARPTRPTANRPACCAAGVCNLCPVDAKFTILNEMSDLLEDPRVTLRLEAAVQAVDVEGGTATGVRWLDRDGREHVARADLVGLGANPIWNPHILLRSGLDGPRVGRRLHEQVSVTADIYLGGVDNFQGTTATTGHGYMLYQGAHRARWGAVMLETWNVPVLRMERGKWRQRMIIKCVVEDLPGEDTRVTVNRDDPTKAEVTFAGHSAYALRAIEWVRQVLPGVLAKAFPVDRVDVSRAINASEGHMMGSTMMGNDPEKSVVDRDCVHHRVRNLLVLGASVFPTGSPANPTPTLCALSLRAADRVLGRSAG